MDSVVGLANLFRWNAQVVLLAAVGGALVWLLRIHAPVIRHAFWRTLLVFCLLLPALQPWASGVRSIVTADVGIAPAIEQLPGGSGNPARRPIVDILTSFVRANGTGIVVIVLALGTAARLAWILAGLMRLRTLRRTSRTAIADASYEELTVLIEAGAKIEFVRGLGQPVTYGLFRPVVLLPDRFPSLPQPVQRAVLAHELWHVRRRDWGFVLIEETVRALFWFNPAVWWLVTQVQTSREEVVDELTVQLTNAKRTYLEALLVFADQPTVFPATPFARRRHLFHRMLLISREAVMSSRRIVTSSIVAGVAVLTAGWAAASAFPLVAPAPAPAASRQAQNPPRDRRPGEAGPESAREIALKKSLADNGPMKTVYFELAALQNQRGAFKDAEETWNAARQAFPNQPDVLMVAAQSNVKIGRFDRAVQFVEEAAALNPTDPKGYQVLAAFYLERAQKDSSLTDVDKRKMLESGVTATDRALAADPNYSDSLVYKNIFLRMQANLESDPARQQQLIAEADALRNRAQAMNRARGGVPGGVPGGVAGGVPGAPPPPPPPPPAPGQEDELVDGVAPLRIGGEIKPPIKTRDVKPEYPAAAQQAKITGVVIVEAILDTNGNVVKTKVLRGVPELDDAATDAVRQWQFTPTLMNGVPQPVKMTVTVNFTLK
jgi:TonB family protein